MSLSTGESGMPSPLRLLSGVQTPRYIFLEGLILRVMASQKLTP